MQSLKLCAVREPSSDEHPAGDPRIDQRGRLPTGRGRLVWASLAFLLVLAGARPLLVDVFSIPFSSMSPTLQAGDRVLVSKLAYRSGRPARRDLVAFRSDESGAQIHIKRVVGLPGDVVALQHGILSINGKVVNEPYVNTDAVDRSTYGPLTIPDGHLFLLGDNRAASTDSRIVGPVPEKDVFGAVLWRIWPPKRAGAL